MDTSGPGLFDRLMGRAGQAGSRDAGIEHVKACVVRDVAALLNTRLGFDLGVLDEFAAVRTSILSYGLTDFAALSTSAGGDRAAMCASIERAIANHEPRLSQVSVELALRDGEVNRLCFVVHARLGSAQPVDLQVMLHRSSQHYEVRRGARSP